MVELDPSLRGSTSPVEQTGVIFLTPQISKEAQEMPELRRYPHGVDLVRKTKSLDDGTERGFSYEHICFAYKVAQLGVNQFAFGPGLIDSSIRERDTGLPDALIFNITQEGLILIGMSEFKLGRIKSHEKLEGFSSLTARLREDPDKFRQALGHSIGGSSLAKIIIPKDDEITVEFVAPRGYSVQETHIGTSPFPVTYSSVPFEPLSVVAAS